MICQVCNEHSAAFERGDGSYRLRMCYSCLSRTGLHLLSGWRLLPVGQAPESCPDCGLGWELFARSGRTGCPACALRFTAILEGLIGGNGARPIPRRTERPPEESDLCMALLLEDYELAARIRDRLDREEAP
jgi:protein-arginine kinase activator protein McsA